MRGYLNLSKISLPFPLLEQAFLSLRKAGEEEVEGVALFAGIQTGNDFLIEETIIPLHTSYHGEDGLFFSIDTQELYRLNKYLHGKGLKLIAQIHSHPERAYHSKADDGYAIITKVGGFSIVVPNYATGPISLATCAVFRLSVSNVWEELAPVDVKELFINT